MKVAVEGCCHGCLDSIYRSVSKSMVDLLVICGDFQSVRNPADLESMAVPEKYKRMGDFQDYYTGRKKAPVFTIFIGGNHEASSYLNELKYGGFVAPNIYYLGRSSVIWYKGLRIGGLSGIYKEGDFQKPAPETYSFPLNSYHLRSVYHYRKEDYFKLKLLERDNNMIMLSHDWPEGIYNHGDVRYLLQRKPFFKKDISNHSLGSPVNMALLQSIRPAFWFSAHLHVKFVAKVEWNNKTEPHHGKRTDSQKSIDIGDAKRLKVAASTDEIELDMSLDEFPDPEKKPTNEAQESHEKCNTDEIELNFEMDDSDIKPETDRVDNSSAEVQNKEMVNMKPSSTQFISLDKCLPKRKYLEFIDVELSDANHRSTKSTSMPLYFDVEYIAAQKVIEKYKQKLQNLKHNQLLDPDQEFLSELSSAKDFYMKEFGSLDLDSFDKLFVIPMNSFEQTVSPDDTVYKRVQNPQTKRFEDNFL